MVGDEAEITSNLETVPTRLKKKWLPLSHMSMNALDTIIRPVAQTPDRKSFRANDAEPLGLHVPDEFLDHVDLGLSNVEILGFGLDEM